MTRKVVIVNAGNRTGDVLEVSNGDRQAKELRRGETHEMYVSSKDAVSFNVYHGIDDDYADNPIVTVSDAPRYKHKIK